MACELCFLLYRCNTLLPLTVRTWEWFTKLNFVEFKVACVSTDCEHIVLFVGAATAADKTNQTRITLLLPHRKLSTSEDVNRVPVTSTEYVAAALSTSCFHVSLP